MKASGVRTLERFLPDTRVCAENLRAAILRGAILCTLVLAAGCAGTGRSNGVRLLERGEFAAAVDALRAESASRPDDPLVRRDLGVALLESGRAADAAEILREVRIALPRDAGTAFQLGRACEGSGDLDGALDAYRGYLALGGRGKDEIAARLQAVTQRRIEAEMRTVLAHEDSLATVEIPDNAVAVPDFSNPARSDSLAPLARGLAAMLISDLGRVGSLRVLERARIRVLLDELGMTADAAGAAPEVVTPTRTAPGTATQGRSSPGSTASDLSASSLVAPDKAPRFGRLLGARRFIQGSFIPLPAEQLQLDASVVEASTGISLPAGAPVSGALSDVLRLQKELLHRVLQALGIELTPDERGRIDELPTRDFLAFLAYSRGLELEDQGRATEATSAYREATRRDPSFAAAASRMRISAVTPSAQQQLDSHEISGLERPEALPAEKVLRTGTWTGLGPGPDTDRRDDLDPGKTDAETASPTDAIIVIEGDVPGRIR